jgi:hypothetical protein
LRAAAPTLRIGGLLVGAALATYLPQFFLAPSLRITHGVVLAAGCLLLAAGAAAGAATGVGVAAATQGRDSKSRYSTGRYSTGR